jgi:hypothetical protein
MKQTAVEWLIEQIKKEHPFWTSIFEQAKEMEKEQIIDAFDEGKSDGYKTAREWDEMVIFSNSDHYYNETYGSKGSDELSKVAENTSFDTSSPTEISDEEFDALLKQVIEVQNLAMYSDISEDYRQGYLDGIKWLYSKLKQK